MDKFSALKAFVTVVEQGSFSLAARRAGVAPSSLTRQVNSLETQLGTPLLNRSTRRLSLTEVGGSYFEDARRILAEIADADRAANDASGPPSGTLRVAAPVAFAKIHISPMLANYLNHYPAIKLDLRLSDTIVNLVDERVDVAIRLANLPDSALVVRKLAPHRRVICASPSYLAERGIPDSPAALVSHNCLLFDYGSGDDSWSFTRDLETQKVRVTGNMRANGSEILLQAALNGVGLVLLATWLVAEHITKGNLVPVLDNWATTIGNDEGTISAVFPANRRGSKKVASFLAHLSEHFGTPAYWDLQTPAPLANSGQNSD